MISLRAISGIEDGFIFGKNRLAVQFFVPGIDGYMLLDLPESAIKTLHIQEYIFRIVMLLFLIVIVGGSVSILCTIRMAKPMMHLVEVMQDVRKGMVQARFTPDALGFEINTLGQGFNRMVDSLLSAQKRVEEERVQKEIYAQELHFGHTIQESLLRYQQEDMPFLVETRYLAAKEVGGDFYDLFRINPSSVFIAIADVAGKGVSACLYSLGLRSALRSAIQSSPLAEALAKTNQLFYLDAHESSMFASIWSATYDETSRQLTYVNAGHWPAYLKKRTGALHVLDTDEGSIGIENSLSIQPKTCLLEKGDLLLLYSDGVVEMQNAHGEYYGAKRLQYLLENTGDIHPQKIVEIIEKDFAVFSGGDKPQDDITLLALQIR